LRISFDYLDEGAFSSSSNTVPRSGQASKTNISVTQALVSETDREDSKTFPFESRCWGELFFKSKNDFGPSRCYNTAINLALKWSQRNENDKPTYLVLWITWKSSCFKFLSNINFWLLSKQSLSGCFDAFRGSIFRFQNHIWSFSTWLSKALTIHFISYKIVPTLSVKLWKLRKVSKICVFYNSIHGCDI